MAALATLLEGGCLYLPGRATSLRPPPAFRLWATVTQPARSSVAAACRSVFRSSLWHHIFVPAPSPTDLATIVRAKFPPLSEVATAMVQTMHALLVATSNADADQQATFSRLADDQAGQAGEGVDSTPFGPQAARRTLQVTAAAVGGRAYSSRDLLKWAGRLNACLASSGLLPTSPSAFRLPPPSSAQFTAYVPPARPGKTPDGSTPCGPSNRLPRTATDRFVS